MKLLQLLEQLDPEEGYNLLKKKIKEHPLLMKYFSFWNQEESCGGRVFGISILNPQGEWVPLVRYWDRDQ